MYNLYLKFVLEQKLSRSTQLWVSFSHKPILAHRLRCQLSVQVSELHGVSSQEEINGGALRAINRHTCLGLNVIVVRIYRSDHGTWKSRQLWHLHSTDTSTPRRVKNSRLYDPPQASNFHKLKIQDMPHFSKPDLKQ
jgi:hypothetical protein